MGLLYITLPLVLAKKRPAKSARKVATYPIFCWLALAIPFLAWHLPQPYELAPRSESWHEFEHACFFDGSLLFWWPVIQPWPSDARWSG